MVVVATAAASAAVLIARHPLAGWGRG